MLQREKLAQAKRIMADMGIDLWITLVRETEQTPDPVLPLISTVDYTWLSALMITQTGRAIALVGNHDEEGVRQTEIWDEVYGYKDDFTPTFGKLLADLHPSTLALNYSRDLPAADGLSHGLYLQITDILNAVQFQGTMCSSSEIVRRLRGQKTEEEVQLIREAVDTAQSIFDHASHHIHPGMSEVEIFNLFHSQLEERKVRPAWLPSQCPGVMAGPDSAQGHNGPSKIRLVQGDVMTVDFGVEQNDYCSDLQRVYYVRENSGTQSLPAEVDRAFRTVYEAVQRAAAFAKPGVTGVEVDTVARDFVRSQGYPEWTYALGHEVGRKAHDGGAVLGPRWERYKGMIDLPLLPGSVFTLELGVPTSRGYVGLEEMILITDAGATFISTPQKSPYIL